ncbi:alpha/beta fold hydrolase [Burkholderia lata]|uniref:alpha/beta fold hydrolase n=1 Tax=Burkholderia lata (strain ATCC 17760 / DSM 23089 / LMG 22485 / NCIMB 9086 / R18194 / 383) TaxID=482957 RepID=UPI00158388B9|nr:alpha/beta hydrolase [Burkholderia lata]
MNDLKQAAVVIPISARAESGRVRVNGVDVTYYDSGEPTAGVDPRSPVVLVHGTGGTARNHYGFLFPILESRQRVLALDFAPPAGGAELALSDLEDQVKAVIEQVLPGRPVTLVGYSLGAVVAAGIASTRPDLVRNLVLIAGWLKTDGQQLIRNKVWRDLYQSGSRAIADFTVFCAFSRSFSSFISPDRLRAITEMIQPGPFDAQQMELNQKVDLSSQVGRIRANTLIIGCSHDQMVPIEHSKLLFGAIANARFVEISSGHGVVFERPGQLSQVVDQFNEDPERYPAGTIMPADHP